MFCFTSISGVIIILNNFSNNDSIGNVQRNDSKQADLFEQFLFVFNFQIVAQFIGNRLAIPIMPYEPLANISETCLTNASSL